jgi:TldD protein
MIAFPLKALYINKMISSDKTSSILGTALSQGGEWADIFAEETLSNRVQLSDQKIKNVSQDHLSGAGVRVVADQREFYAYTNDVSETGLTKVAKEIADAVSRKQNSKSLALQEQEIKQEHLPKKTPDQIPWDDKVSLVRRANEIARTTSEKIIQVNADYYDETQRIIVANSEGLHKTDKRTRGRFSVTAIASDGQEKQVGYEAPGAQRGFEFFEVLDVDRVAREASESAVRMLTAAYAPQGRMTVIIDSGFGGVIFHEACGHLLEASSIAKKASVMTGKLGHVIASDVVSAVDDATLPHEWGSLNIDDEGVATQRNLLIENGILKSYLVDRLNGERLGLESTGSSRRQSYRFAPTSRMNNTFILPGTSTLEEMITATDEGLYAKKLGGGSVNPATGEFNFSVTEGYLIKNGKITKAVRGAVLIGRGEEILKKIDMVGSELALAQGVCGAASGWIPVNVGQPAIRVKDLLVGGR